MKFDTIVVDTKNYMSIATYSIRSGSIPCTHPVEADEIKARVFKKFFALRLEHPTADIYLALDKKPYWREAFLEDWYALRTDIEPVAYKGNRGKAEWSLETTPEQLQIIHEQAVINAMRILEFKTLGDVGLEADDIWGLLSKEKEGKTLGISTDHDWAQCCKKGSVYLHNPVKNTTSDEPLDMRPFYLGGDAGDCIKGCPKYTKKGTLAKNGWGITGATKHVAANPTTWDSVTDEAHVEKNYNVMKLPCPLWDVKVSMKHLMETEESMEAPSAEEVSNIFNSYSLPASLRKKLQSKEEREAFIDSLRAKLQDKLYKKEEK